MSDDPSPEFFLHEVDGYEFAWLVERNTIEPGASFSAEALDAVYRQIAMFITSRVMRRWEDTGEPPTRLQIEVKAVAS